MAEVEKVVVVLHYTENDVHLIACETLEGAKALLEGAKANNEEVILLSIMGMDAVCVTNFDWLPMDTEIVKQIIRTYLGVVGVQGHQLYAENTLLSALEN